MSNLEFSSATNVTLNEPRRGSDIMFKILKRRVTLKRFIVYSSFLGLFTCVSLFGYTFVKDPTNSRFYKEMSNGGSTIGRYIERANHLRKTCRYLQDRVKKIEYEDLDVMQEIYRMGNTSICVVPKSGCSFLKRLVYYLSEPYRLLYSDKLITLKLEPRLAYIDKIQREIFNLTRWQIHYTLDYRPLQIKEQDFIVGNFRKVIVARNPYSRLFSAYIDKVFVPMVADVFQTKYRLKSEQHGTLTKSQMCSGYVSFEDFLEVVISESRHGKGNKHWIPASVLCNACEVNPDIVIKQETYHEDIEFFLSQIDVNETQWKTIDSVIAKRGIQSDSIVTGLIKTMYYNGVESAIDCFSRMETARRVWEALKIQGQIYEYLEFPEEKLALTDLSVSNVSDVFLSEMKTMPLSPEESRNQRQRSLVNAYRYVRLDLLIQIQAIFYYDFLIYQYDFNPPK